MKNTAALELGTQKTGILLRKYAIPAIIAMTAASLYNIVDSIFIGRGIGAYALSGLAVTFPFMNLTAALGTLIGVGCSTLLSIKLGQKDYAVANKILGNEIVLNILIASVYTILCLVFLNPILRFFGAGEMIITYAKDYMTIILMGNIITFLFQGLNHLLRASGHPRTAMLSMLATVLINVILDALFIFVFEWGIMGAAFATLLSQIIALVWLAMLYSNPQKILHFQKGIYKLDFNLIKKALPIGLSPFILNSLTTLIVILVNKQLAVFGGDLAIGAFGIVNRVWFIFIMVVLGITQGMQPIVGYNYGANRMDRAFDTLKKAILSVLVILSLATIFCVSIPEYIVGLFTEDEVMIQMAVKGLRIMMLSIPFLGFQMVISIFFQCVGFPGKSIFLNVFRLILILIPCLYILPLLIGEDGIWYSFNISDIVSCLLAALMLYRFISQKLKFHR